MDRCWRQQRPDSFQQLPSPPVLLSPPHPPHPAPPDRCSCTAAAFLLFMGPACFDFKYLPRRRLFRSVRGGGVVVAVGGAGGGGVDLEHTKSSLSGCAHVHVWAEVEAQFVLFLSQRGESSVGPVLMTSREKPSSQLIQTRRNTSLPAQVCNGINLPPFTPAPPPLISN